MSHTEGKLMADALNITLNGVQKTYYCIGKAGTKDVVAIIGEVGDGQDELSSADARRLVACWNACEGMPQDDIEELEKMPNGVMNLTVHADDLRKERDELVRVLRQTVKYANRKPFNLTKEIDAILRRHPETATA